MNGPTLQELQERLSQAWLALGGVNAARENETNAMKMVAEESIRDAMEAKWGAAQREKQAQLQAAQDALEAAQMSRGEAILMALPRGVLHEWQPDQSQRYVRPQPWVPSGRTGRFEVCTMDSVFPEGMRWGKPSVGDVFIRVLKRDGTPSTRFEMAGGLENLRRKWLPEGQAYADGAEHKGEAAA